MEDRESNVIQTIWSRDVCTMHGQNVRIVSYVTVVSDVVKIDESDTDVNFEKCKQQTRLQLKEKLLEIANSIED